MKKFWTENKRHLTFLGIAVLFLSLLPVFETVVNFGFHSWVVPPSYIDDNYYYVRMKEIVDGQPMLGNPYLKEHAQDIAATWVLPDWLYSLPLLAGAPLFAAVSINFSLWSLVLALLLYIFLRKTGLPRSWSAFGTFFCYTQVYIFVLRPISMQLVFPVFIAYLLAWFSWRERPDKKSTVLLLGAVTALAFYDYPYLWQIVVVFSGLMLFYFLWKKEQRVIKYFFITNALALVLLIPFILFTLRQISHPLYWETMARTGLVATHLPTAVAFYTGVWILSLSTLLLLSLRWVPEFRKYSGYVRFVVTFSIMGISMLIVSASNLITGKELETANHVERFVRLWLAIGLVVLIYYFFTERKMLLMLPSSRKFLLCLLVFVVLTGNISYSGDLSTFVHSKYRLEMMQEYREYMPAFAWLDAQEIEPQVVWTDPTTELRSILPIYTKHYVLYSPPTILHLVSDDEIQERYLTAQYLSEPTVKSMAKDAGNFAGVARGFHLAGTHNREVKLCRLLRLDLFGKDCGILTDSVTLNTPLSEQMFLRFTNEIKPNIDAKIEKFHVRYIMTDKEHEATFHPELLKNVTRVYEDTHAVIYRRN
jgi:MFS family permease